MSRDAWHGAEDHDGSALESRNIVGLFWFLNLLSLIADHG
jgi:hypothetical protein